MRKQYSDWPGIENGSIIYVCKAAANPIAHKHFFHYYLLIYSLQKLVEQMYQSITLPDKRDCCTSCTCWETYLCQLVFTKTRALHCVITWDAASQQNVSGFCWNYIPWKIGKKSMYLHLFESIDTKDKRARRLLLLRTSTLNNKLNIHIRPHRKKAKVL